MTRGNPRSSGYARQSNDWYQEPRRAIEELLDVETFIGSIYDPACGGGNIPEACKARGLRASGSDIEDRGYGGQSYDFLGSVPLSAPPDHIITNPPFDLAEEFALRCLEVAEGLVCILQRLSWLEGERRYQRLWSRNQLMRVWQFRSRISMPPGGAGVTAKGGSVAFAWFVFWRQHRGTPTLGWIP